LTNSRATDVDISRRATDVDISRRATDVDISRKNMKIYLEIEIKII